MMFRFNIHFRTAESHVESDYVAHLERKNERLEADLKTRGAELGRAWAEIERLKVASDETAPTDHV